MLLAEFRFAWAGLMAKSAANLNASHVTELTTLARDFVTKVELLAEEETTAWAQRFSERLSAFDRNPNLKVTLSAQQAAGGAGAVLANGTSGASGKANGSTGQGEAEVAHRDGAQDRASNKQAKAKSK